MTGGTRVAFLDDIPAGGVKLVQVGDRPIALFRVGEKVYAVDDRCPHRGGPLSEGTREDLTVTCPWHEARFDIPSGKALSGPAPRGLTCFRVEIVGKEVWVGEPLTSA